MNVLLWFRRDLRVSDHPALTLAATLGPVLPLFVADPGDWSQPGASARQWAFVTETLAGLRDDLAALGAPLVVRTGPADEVLAALCRRHRIGRILCLADPGRCDARVAGWAAVAGVQFDVLPAGPDQPLPPPPLIPVPGVAPGGPPEARLLGLTADRCPHRQAGGRANALTLLDPRPAPPRGLSPLARRERAASRLSPHLAWGVLSGREVAAALPRLRQRLALRAGCGDALPGVAGLWASGETGLPILDAAHRYWAATGWLPDDLRALLAGFALQQLGIAPATVAATLARLSTDHDPAVMAAQIARCAAARPVDPVQRGEVLDPDGAFVRRWCPELAAVPAAHLHRPWRWSGARRLHWPEPVADPASATRAARAGHTPGPAAPGARPTLARRPAAGQMALDL